MTAITLAKTYQVALLTIDGIVREAIGAGNTPAAMRARQMCAETARRHCEEERHQEGEEGEKKAPGGLSVEAVTAHTQGTGGRRGGGGGGEEGWQRTGGWLLVVTCV